MNEEQDQRDDDICECGHYRDEHEGGSGQCQARASSGYACACPSVEPLPPTREQLLEARISFLEEGMDELLLHDVISSGRHRELMGITPEKQRERWKLQICANCGEKHPGIGRTHCRECDWVLANRKVPDAPLCSVCRRRHGPEKEHPCE